MPSIGGMTETGGVRPARSPAGIERLAPSGRRTAYDLLNRPGSEITAPARVSPFFRVKVSKPNQDFRFDVPVIGPLTLEAARDAFDNLFKKTSE